MTDSLARAGSIVWNPGWRRLASPPANSAYEGVLVVNASPNRSRTNRLADVWMMKVMRLAPA